MPERLAANEVGHALRRGVACAAAVLMLVGCAVGSRAEAGRIASAWLTAIADPTSPDRGFQLLHPSAQQKIGGFDSYLIHVKAAEWTFEWEIDEGMTTSDDGFHIIEIDVATGRHSVPAFLLENDLIQFARGDDQTAAVIVRFEPLSQGIYAPDV